ncbi:unnamed protein product [Darwinula stevensoni]|uniref:POU domain protein n=1 Tax=Darwinula stevensoni TaxID=69355 RepID=A0A7R9AE26_9CRUS|nr:unnamed protein product [Darwinula stevensoni]CAG0901295.1 unnamed protein product [Darwinula stevensoni]
MDALPHMTVDIEASQQQIALSFQQASNLMQTMEDQSHSNISGNTNDKGPSGFQVMNTQQVSQAIQFVGQNHLSQGWNGLCIQGGQIIQQQPQQFAIVHTNAAGQLTCVPLIQSLPISTIAQSQQEQSVMPQVILTSGNYMQSLSGTQVLIPTPQGLAVQQLLTLPMTSPMVSFQNGQLVSAQASPVQPPLGSLIYSTQPQALCQETQQEQPIETNQLMPSNNDGSTMCSTQGNSSSNVTHNNLKVENPDIIASTVASVTPIFSTFTPEMVQEVQDQPTINEISREGNTHIVDGVDLKEIKEFAKEFKMKRLAMGLTQTQVGLALSATAGPAYSQSAICRFEKLDITPKSAQKIKPVLEKWMKEAEESYQLGRPPNGVHIHSPEHTKKRKKRTSFSNQAVEYLNEYFKKKTHPTGTEISGIAHQLGYDREVIRIWFCNKRQALKNAVRLTNKIQAPRSGNPSGTIPIAPALPDVSISTVNAS